jgi:uncharacterized membrane protein YeaQ/YmgE (transglycosylase-associated protein family)
MFGFIGWIIVGFVAGLLGRLLVPGRQPMGFMKTIALGLVGSILGGFISSAMFGTDPMDPGFHAGGLIMSTVGAVIVLGGYLALTRDRTNPNPRMFR